MRWLVCIREKKNNFFLIAFQQQRQCCFFSLFAIFIALTSEYIQVIVLRPLRTNVEQKEFEKDLSKCFYSIFNVDWFTKCLRHLRQNLSYQWFKACRHLCSTQFCFPFFQLQQQQQQHQQKQQQKEMINQQKSRRPFYCYYCCQFFFTILFFSSHFLLSDNQIPWQLTAVINSGWLLKRQFSRQNIGWQKSFSLISLATFHYQKIHRIHSCEN